MSDTEILHNAVRYYCIDQIAVRQREYRALCKAGRDRTTIRSGTSQYTGEARNLFPRYNVLRAILRETERFVPADFSSEAEARSLLELAGATAADPFTTTTNTIERSAIADERRLFIDFVKSADVRAVGSLPPLPFRRVLGILEHAELHKIFAKNWGRWYGGAVDGAVVGSEVATLHVEAMALSSSYSLLREALGNWGIARILEFRESGDGLELAIDAASFCYNGDEGFWTSGDMDWMVYASHEASISFGGSWLIERMRIGIPNFDRWIYKGWDLADYDVERDG